MAQIGLSALKLPGLNRRIHVHRNPEPVQWHYTTGDNGRGKVSVNIYDFLMLHGNRSRFMEEKSEEKEGKIASNHKL